MEYDGIIITGTSGAGKSTIARTLCERKDIFQIVQAVTTRKKREDDRGEYLHITNEEFEKLERNKELLVKAEYMGETYGITHEAFKEVIDKVKIPLLTITPQSVRETENNKNLIFFTIFVDAPDDILNERLTSRKKQIDEAIKKQREEDRKYKENCLYTIYNMDIGNTIELILALWEYRTTGGILPKRLIKLMIECGMLLKKECGMLLKKDDIKNNITGAAYDLSLGDEYYYGGNIRKLSNKEPFILIEPYDYAIVTSKEFVDFPRDIAGRFDLSVSLFCQGVILSNGPQVDPGFRGTLFCLLFNTSNAPIFLKRGQHYSTLEFHKLMEPTIPYEGPYQGKSDLVYYLPSNTMQGGINELKKELEKVKHASQNLQTTFLAVVSLILVIIAMLVTLLTLR